MLRGLFDRNVDDGVSLEASVALGGKGRVPLHWSAWAAPLPAPTTALNRSSKPAAYFLG